MKTRNALLIVVVCASGMAQAQWQGKFEQLDQALPTPNSYRAATGAPGENYWQNRADYDIQAELRDDKQQIEGKETIAYYNNSPEPLRYLWLQLDQNHLAPNSFADKTRATAIIDSVPTRFFHLKHAALDYRGGFTIRAVRDEKGKPLPYAINHTMMRVDLPEALASGGKYVFQVAWSYYEKNLMYFSERGGYEYFPKDDNYLYACAQWFPRMCVFDDDEGWQNQQFLGDAEYALPFGNYSVKLAVPADHVVAATGILQNPQETLSTEQRRRWEQAKQSFDKPVFIVTEEEARFNEAKKKTKKKKVWHFAAENVRDFAFASSRKFIWDAMAVKINDKTPMAQSFYPKEANPLWGDATAAIKNALEVYSSRTIDYPYPNAIAINCAEQGMEYPMICFNGSRPAQNGKATQADREEMTSVIVHEVGHNFFPMIVNSDERRYAWMDEGLNSFLEKETMRLRYSDMDYSQNTPAGVIDFMSGDKASMRPIMAMPDAQEYSLAPNGYFKPAAALTILREVVMGESLFDYAFQQYARQWAFKHPKPADFFRAMETASGVDLDWFWRGWFYTTDHVDVNLSNVAWRRIEQAPPANANANKKPKKAAQQNLVASQNVPEGARAIVLAPTTEEMYAEYLSRINEAEFVERYKDKNYYELTFQNEGGLVTPLIIEWTYADDSKEIETLPAEIWRTNEQEIKKSFVKDKQVKKVTLDPLAQTADTNVSNNAFPRAQK